MTEEKLKDVATNLADWTILSFPMETFQYDYLVNGIIAAIENAKETQK